MMKQNKYDDEHFFSAYEKMPRSVKGLEGAGEWHVLKALMPELRNKNVLDLGCGFGWHCRYVREQKASLVIGVDISEKMLQKARENTDDPLISYIKMPIEKSILQILNLMWSLVRWLFTILSRLKKSAKKFTIV